MVNPSASRTLKRKTLIWAGSASKENGFCEACLSGYHSGELDSPKWPAVTLQSWLKLNHCFAGSESLKSQFIPTKITLCCLKSFKFPNVSCLKPCFPSCFQCFSTCFPCISACVPWWFMFSDVSHMFPTFLHIFPRVSSFNSIHTVAEAAECRVAAVAGRSGTAASWTRAWCWRDGRPAGQR